jgi:hypothetical protein
VSDRTAPAGPGPHDRPATETKISQILLTSLTALAAAGETEKACRLAGQACVALRGADPVAARRFDVLLHLMPPALDW